MRLNTDIKNLRNNFISLLILRGGNYLVPLITLPYLINVLGVEKFGLVAFAEMIVMYFKSIVDYGFDLTGTRVISENRGDKKKVDELVNTIYSAKIFLTTICFLMLLILITYVPKLNEISLLLIYSYGIVLGNTLLPIWFFQGVEKMKFITIINFISKLIYVFLLVLIIKQKRDYIYVPLLNSIGLIVGGFLSMFIMVKEFRVRFGIPKYQLIIHRLKVDFNIFISTLTPNLYNNSMGVFLGIYTSNVLVGYYSAATKLIEVGNSVVNIISTAVFPYLSRSSNNKQKLLNAIMFLGLITSIFFLVFKDFIVCMLFGEGMEVTIDVLQIISLSPFFIAMMNTYGVNTLVVGKRDKIVRNIVLFYSGLGFVMGLLFIKEHGIIAAAIILVTIRAMIGMTEYIIVKFKLFT